MGVAAVCAGEMRMALSFGTVMGQLEVLSSFIQQNLMDQADLNQAIEGSINCDLVEVSFAGLVSDLFLAQRRARLNQDFEYRYSSLRTVEFRLSQHIAGLFI